MIRKVNIHAGHTSSKGKSQGAVGFLNESDEARKVVKQVIKLLKKDGCTVYDCTAEGTSERDNLHRIVEKCNAHNVDIDVSIHFNSGRCDSKGDGKTGGVEVYAKSLIDKRGDIAKDICKRIASLGFTNRGAKTSNNLYVLNYTYAPAILVECCFVDDKDDCTLYDYKEMAKRIAWGIVGHVIYTKPVAAVNAKSAVNKIKWVQQHLTNCGVRCPVTGIWDANTVAAVKKYRKQIGWKPGAGKKATVKMIGALYKYRRK